MCPLQHQLSNFLCYITTEKGLSPHTIEAYGRDLKQFISHLKKSEIHAFPQVTTLHIINFIADFKSQDYASTSISRAFIAIRVLFRFLKREQIISENIALHLETPKTWQSIPTVLTVNEMERLLAQPDRQTANGARDAAILELLYSSGVRASELCLLKIVDVDDDAIKVFGKGGKERLVPIGKPAINAIDHYLIHFRGRFEGEEETLFLTQWNKPLNRIALWQIVKRHALAAGIAKNISPHTLRHSFATHLLDNNADLRIIQEMLGHATINSTERYAHVSQKHLKEAFDRCHPRL